MPTAAVPAEVEKVPVFLHPLEEAKRCQPHTTSRVYLTEYTLWARFTYGKSPLLMGKRTISMAIFNSFVSHYQRVGLSLAWVCLKINVNHHFPSGAAKFLDPILPKHEEKPIQASNSGFSCQTGSLLGAIFFAWSWMQCVC